MNTKKIKLFCKEHKKGIGRAAVGLVLIVALLFFYFNGEKDKKYIDAGKAKAPVAEATKEEANGKIVVDISGQVHNPGVYELEGNSRLNDVINMAGGLLDDADIDSINRAEAVEDGQKVFVPKKAGEEEVSSDGASGGKKDGEKININKADVNQLQSLPGVGPSTAEKIVKYRQENGKFKAPEDLKNVSGIGEKTFEKMADSITVQG